MGNLRAPGRPRHPDPGMSLAPPSLTNKELSHPDHLDASTIPPKKSPPVFKVGSTQTYVVAGENAMAFSEVQQCLIARFPLGIVRHVFDIILSLIYIVKTHK